MVLKLRSKFIFIALFIAFCFLGAPLYARADTVGQTTNFFVSSEFDAFKREKISAVLQRIGFETYFYIEKEFLNGLDAEEKEALDHVLYELDVEFHYNIYHVLTSAWGAEWNPGIDKDKHITILIHPMIENAGGYFMNGDEYTKAQNPNSNQREMFYLNSDYISTVLAKSYLAHEFTHLITWNQKDRIRGISEEIWLNEARAEYAPTLLGYDADYENSNLQSRVNIFLTNSSDSLTEWRGQEADYGGLNLFIQYLVEHYGIKVLEDSMLSPEIGIASLNYALERNGFGPCFKQVFTNWIITVLINNASVEGKYYYKNEDLQDLRIAPSINFLPFGGESSLRVVQRAKEWSGNWYKIVGGQSVLKLEFFGNDKVDFEIPYVVVNKSGAIQVDFLELDENQQAVLFIPDFNTENTSLTIMPFSGSKLSGFDGAESRYGFSFVASTVEKDSEQEQQEQERLAKIESLKKQIALVQVAINAILAQKEQEQASAISCAKIEQNLYYGLQQSSQVKCLQEFLKSQGSGIYPEALITGNFFSLTQKAVIRFQEKYAQEILFPLGLSHGTGYVGERTREKINNLLKSQ